MRKHEWNPFNTRQEMGAEKDQVKNWAENDWRDDSSALTSESVGSSCHHNVGIEQKPW